MHLAIAGTLRRHDATAVRGPPGWTREAQVPGPLPHSGMDARCLTRVIGHPGRCFKAASDGGRGHGPWGRFAHPTTLGRVISTSPGPAAHAALGHSIRTRRELQRMTRLQLAQRVGISESTLQRLERGYAAHQPNPRDIADIARVLGLTADDIRRDLSAAPELAEQACALLAYLDGLPFVGRPTKPKAPAAPAVLFLRSHGVRADDIAARLGVDRHTVYSWLNGRRAASPALREAVAQLINEEAADYLLSLVAEREGGRSRGIEQLNAAGLTRQDVAVPLGVDPSAVSWWFLGRSPAPPALASLLRYKLGAERAAPIIAAVPEWQPEPGARRA